jgi:hypothetical protein
MTPLPLSPLILASLTPPALVLAPLASLALAVSSPGTEKPVLRSSQLQNKSIMPGTPSHLVGLGIDAPALVLASLTPPVLVLAPLASLALACWPNPTCTRSH